MGKNKEWQVIYFITMNIRTKKIGAPATGRAEANKSVTAPHQSFRVAL